SAREKQLLRSFAERGGLSQKDLAFIKEWINHSDEFAKRNALFWHAAKKSMLGSVVYETARERHRTLGDKEWLIAYFTVEGMGQKEIARLTHVGERTVDQMIRTLKDRITQEVECDIESVGLPQIARWFFGL